MKSLIGRPKTHMAGERCVPLVRSVAVLENGALGFVSVKSAIHACVVSDEWFHCFDTDYRAAVAMGVGNR